MIDLLARWKLVTYIVTTIGLFGYIGVLKIDNVEKSRTIALLDADLATALANHQSCKDDIAVAIREKLNDKRLNALSVDELVEHGARWVHEGNNDSTGGD